LTGVFDFEYSKAQDLAADVLKPVKVKVIFDSEHDMDDKNPRN
jgi:hypothetical protein